MFWVVKWMDIETSNDQCSPKKWLSFTYTSWELTGLSPKQIPSRKPQRAKTKQMLLLQFPYPWVRGKG